MWDVFSLVTKSAATQQLIASLWLNRASPKGQSI